MLYLQSSADQTITYFSPHLYLMYGILISAFKSYIIGTDGSKDQTFLRIIIKKFAQRMENVYQTHNPEAFLRCYLDHPKLPPKYH